MPHKFLQNVVELDFFDEADLLINHADLKAFSQIARPECWRFIHFDLATARDVLGAASVYAVPGKELLFRDEGTDLEVEKRERMYFLDWILYIRAKPGQQIPLYKVKDFILYLKKIGYPIRMVSADSYASEDMLQQMTLSGLEAKNVSVDRTKGPYISLRETIYRGKMVLVNHPRLIKELLDLQDVGDKIDHPITSSKDGSDGVAGAYWSCLKAPQIVNPVSLLKVEERERQKRLERMIMTESQSSMIEKALGGV